MNLLFIILNIYFVSFTDKAGSTPPALSSTAIEMREAHQIAIDELDYPVSVNYLNQVQSLGAKIHHTSRWFNGATIETEDSTVVQNIRSLPFVISAVMTRDHTKASSISLRKKAVQENAAIEPITDDQLELYNLSPLHNLGYEGQGIRMAICDGGFQYANTLAAFRQAQELGHFDFTDDTDDFYGTTGSHGTQCLSTITGIIKNDYYGAATKATYYLMRSEEAQTESPKEMDNLVAALEKADSLGVHIFSVSLGYTVFDNSTWDLPQSALDGRTTRASCAATIAARKGMLVCVAAGNDGDKSWKKIGIPADADSILAVGAVDIDGVIGGFSSFGPSADGRVKPDVCAVGVNTAVVSPYGFSMYGSGTSFACPLIAGFAATLWSAMPQKSNMQIRDLILRSSDRYTNPSVNRYGYGIPDAMKAYQLATELPQIPSNNSTARKIIRDGAIWIIVDGKEYNVLGIRH